MFCSHVWFIWKILSEGLQRRRGLEARRKNLSALTWNVSFADRHRPLLFPSPQHVHFGLRAMCGAFVQNSIVYCKRAFLILGGHSAASRLVAGGGVSRPPRPYCLTKRGSPVWTFVTVGGLRCPQMTSASRVMPSP